MSKNIFLTGAAGFIGSHLASYLHTRGDRVVGFDNFNIARQVHPELTTIDKNIYEKGQIAARTLLDILKEKSSRGSNGNGIRTCKNSNSFTRNQPSPVAGARLILPVRLVERETA